MSLAFPPFHLFFPSFVCLVPAVILIDKGNRDRLPLRRQLQYGFVFGLLANGLLLYWMVFALWRYTPLSVLGYAGTVLLLSAFYAALFASCGWAVRVAGAPILLAFPTLWTALEWLLVRLGDMRYPWLGLGTSLTGFRTVVQFADVVGARGITLLLALANTLIALAWLRRRERRKVIQLTGVVVLGLAMAVVYGVYRERTLGVRAIATAVLVQPNVGYEEKWNADLQDTIVGSLISTSALAHSEFNPDLIIWPEVAVPGDLARRHDWSQLVADFARRSNTTLVTGALHSEVLTDSSRVRYNSAFVFDSVGRTAAYPVYHKQYLVPITERVPFLPRGMLAGRWFGSFGAGDAGAVYDLGFGGFGLLICYESAFEDLARNYRSNGADFLVNITNDVWFGHTSAPYQHAAHLVMRAIENRVGIVRAANTGISEFVDPLGRQSERTRLEEETYVFASVQTSDVLTLYARVGDWIGGTAALMAFSLLAYAWWRRRSAR